MAIKIALAGNPNSGKTTLFNALTGSNQFVGNWPGVTVEKKEGKLKNNKDVVVVDLPGIYSLSPYTLEEVIARNYIIDERPDVILNIIDGTNLERNLYLTTQLVEIGVPVIVAVNMIDIVKKNNDKIDIAKLSKELGCEVYEISALKGTGIIDAANAAVKVAQNNTISSPQHTFSGSVEHAIAHIEEYLLHDMPDHQQRWYAIKLFERDNKIVDKLKIDKSRLDHIEDDIVKCENELDDDSESIITSERYTYIESVIKDYYKKKSVGALTISDKIDRVVTNRWLALPIFAVIMFIVYFVSVTTVGTIVTDWANDGVFGDGWFILGIGRSAYDEVSEEYAFADEIVAAHEEGLTEYEILDEEGNVAEVIVIDEALLASSESTLDAGEPEPGEYGVWVPGLPVLIGDGLEAIGAADWLQGLILDGIVGGVGAILGFVPQMLILFIFLAFLEGCGYMARIAFILDRIFRKFGLSGKSFIPMLIGTGCGVPGVMASRTIENERDRRMTVMTTTFIPCAAKLPIIALISGALFGGAWWVAPSAYFVGIISIIISGIILKKTKMFSGDPAPFVMELPSYHMPTVGSILRSMWERGWSFIKKAGTIILLSAIIIWFTSAFGWADGQFGMVEDMADSVLAKVGTFIAPIFAPLGWGNWQSSVATLLGLVAKEVVVGTFGILYGFAEVAENGFEIWNVLAANFTVVSAYSFLVFNLLCAPCFAAIGAIRREMNSGKWTFFAIAYQTIFAYAIALIVYQIGSLFTGGGFGVGTVVAIILIAVLIYFLFRRGKDANPIEEAQRGKSFSSVK